MKLLNVHPSSLFFTKVFLRLEPLGLELTAQAARLAGHEVQLIDLQVENHKAYFKLLDSWQPDVVAISCSYLANVPEVIDLCKVTKQRLPLCFVIVGGHSASFIPEDLLNHSEGAIDCILKGEGEATIQTMLSAIENDRKDIHHVPGVVTKNGSGPPPTFVQSLDDIFPARDLLRKRRHYFIGVLDPCASIEFSRGCPWDCSFCSAWTFYGRHYREVSPEKVVENLQRIEEKGVFIVDDVAFLNSEHGIAIGEEILRKGIKKQFYLETRADVLLRNKEVFEFWKKVGLEYMFVGLEAIDEEGLNNFRKRISLNKNFEALEAALSLDISIAINIIADPDWDENRFEIVRQWSQEFPGIVNISVNTPYPGTESWLTESRQLTTKDYRLFDIQHAVLPTRLPVNRFYEELVKTQQVLNMKFLGWSGIKDTGKVMIENLLRGQTNSIKMLWGFNSFLNPELQLNDHQKPVKYELTPPPEPVEKVNRDDLYILKEGI
jgi:hopanoid C-3 methylase HpnR